MANYKAIKNSRGFHLVLKYKMYDILCTNNSHIDFDECLNCKVLVDTHSVINSTKNREDESIIELDNKSLMLTQENGVLYFKKDQDSTVIVSPFNYVP